MNPEKFTIKTQEAFNASQTLATRLNHSELKSGHLLAAMLDQEGGLARPLIEKSGANALALRSALDAQLDRQPKVTGSAASLYLSNDMRGVMAEAEDQQKKLKDDYLSVEHVLLAMLKKSEELKSLFAAQSLTYDAVFKSLTAVRGAQRVTDQDPEGK